MKIVLTLLLCLTPAIAQAPVTAQQHAIIAAWNECSASIDKENGLIRRLTKSLQLNPPWRVVDAREPEIRAELIDKIIAEHKKRIELLERIKREDSYGNAGH
jgi:hypothetical protein